MTAYVSEVSVLGVVQVKFSQGLKPFNLTDLNETNVGIYIQPANKRHLYEHFNLTKLNFTWESTKHETDTIFLKLLWEDRASVSPLFMRDQDSLVVDLSKATQM